MPTYEYRCDACGHHFELFQSMTAPVKRKCPKCSKPRLQRLIGTGAGIIFKGGGFYETDYRSESYKKTAEAEKKTTEPAAVETKSQTAPAGSDASTKSDAKTGSSSAEPKPKPKVKSASPATGTKRSSKRDAD